MFSMILASSGTVNFFTTIGNFFSVLGEFATAVINFLLFFPFILILAGVLLIAFFAEMVFKKLAGIDTIYLGNTAFGGANNGGQDLVYAFITEPAVQDVFWAIVSLSFVLLFVFTIVALIKSEFTLDLKGSAKSPIIARALKSLVNFAVVPVVTLISVIGVNFLTKTVYDLFSTTGDSVVVKCFYVGAYNANRARLDPVFAEQLSSNHDFDGNDIFNGASPFAGSGSADQVAYMIDQYFLDGTDLGITYNNSESYLKRILNCDLKELKDGYVSFSNILFGYPKNGECNMLNAKAVNFYYDLSQFDYILAIGSAVCMTWILLTTCLVLVKRVFELTILFLLAPAMTAIAPLDGGQAEKKWRQEFMKRLLAVIGPIFAFNMYFLLVPLFSSISLFGAAGSISPTVAGGGTMLSNIIMLILGFTVIFDILFQLICVITGMSIVKSASGLLSSLLGIEDLVKSGGEAGKKAVATGAKAALLATGAGGVAMKGAAMALKVGGRIAGKAAKGAGKLASKAGQGGKKLLNKVTTRDGQQLGDAISDKVHGAADWVSDKVDTVKEWGAGVKDSVTGFGKKAAKGTKKFLGKTGIIAEDVSSDLTRIDSEQEDRKARLDIAKDELDALEEKGKGIDDVEARKAHNKKVEELRESIKQQEEEYAKGQKERTMVEAKGKGIYQSEFGKDAGVTSMFARFADSVNSKAAIFKNIPLLNKIPELTNSWKEQFAIDGETAKRRLNDGIAGIFGDSGAGDLYKMWFNKNARAGLYEGVPESKKRTAGIEAGLSWGGKAKYDREEQEKKDRDQLERLIKRMLAEGRGNKEYENLIKQRENAATDNPTEIKKLDAKIEKMEVETGLAADARAFYDKAAGGDAGAKAKIEEYKKKLEKEAAMDAYGREVKQKQAAEEGKQAWIEQQDKAGNAAASKMKMDAESQRELANKMGEAVKKAMSGSKLGLDENAYAKLQQSLQSAFEGMSFGEMAQAMTALVEAIEKLK